MKLANDVKATVFELKKAENRKNTFLANISTFEGKDQDDNPKYSSWNTYFVGDAFDKASNLRDKDHIVITSGKIENTYDKEKKRLYVNVTVFDFEMDE